jgi:hypothetical protein
MLLGLVLTASCVQHSTPKTITMRSCPHPEEVARVLGVRDVTQTINSFNPDSGALICSYGRDVVQPQQADASGAQINPPSPFNVSLLRVKTGDPRIATMTRLTDPLAPGAASLDLRLGKEWTLTNASVRGDLRVCWMLARSNFEFVYVSIHVPESAEFTPDLARSYIAGLARAIGVA